MTAQAFSIATLATAAAAGSRSSAASRPDTDTQHTAWQREMEKAESQAWFKTVRDKVDDKGTIAIVATGSATWSAPGRPISSERAELRAAEEVARKAEPAAEAPSQAATVSRPFAADGPRSEGQRDSAETAPKPDKPQSMLSGTAGRAVPVQPQATLLSDPDAAGLAWVASQRSPTPCPAPFSPSWSGEAVSSPRIQPPAQPLTSASPVSRTDVIPQGAIAPNITDGTATAATSAVSIDSRRPLAAVLSRALEPTPGLQFHVEWNEAGAATVWIGAAASATPDLPALVDALSRWISRAGMRLRSVVCNGVSCFEDADRCRPGAAKAGDQPATTHSTPSIDVIIDRED